MSETTPTTDTTELIRRALAVIYAAPLPDAVKRALDDRLQVMLPDPGAFGRDAEELPREVLAMVAADPEPPQSFIAQVFQLEPDDVVLIGGVTGGLKAIESFMRWAQREWPDRKVVCFADDIDVEKWREAEAAGVSAESSRGGES